jgi:hypothetical protein
MLTAFGKINQEEEKNSFFLSISSRPASSKNRETSMPGVLAFLFLWEIVGFGSPTMISRRPPGKTEVGHRTDTRGPL